MQRKYRPARPINGRSAPMSAPYRFPSARHAPTMPDIAPRSPGITASESRPVNGLAPIPMLSCRAAKLAVYSQYDEVLKYRQTEAMQARLTPAISHGARRPSPHALLCLLSQ